IEFPELVERLAPPASEVHGVDLTFVLRIMRPPAARAESRLKRRGDGLADPTVALCDPWTAYIIRFRFAQGADTFANVVFRVNRVGIHADDHVPTRRIDRGVEPRGNDAAGIID